MTTTIALGPSWLDPDHLINTYGLWGVLLIVFAESGLLIGFFLPGDSLLFTTGLLVASGTLHQPLALVAALIACAAVLGEQTGYWFGRKVGPSLFRRPDSRLFKMENIEKAHGFFEHHGPKAIVMACFVPIVRTFTPIVAGVSRMNYRTFATYNVLGGTLWGAGVTLLGYWLGQISVVRDNIEAMLVLVVLVSLVPIGIEYLRSRGKAAAAGTGRRSADALSGEHDRGTTPPPEGPGSGGALGSGTPASVDPYGQGGFRSAFTPPEGIPVLPPEGALWQDRMRAMIRLPATERPAPAVAAGAAATAGGVSVPRVLDLTLRIGELLLAGGEGAEDVEAAMFGVAYAYGLARVEPTVTFTLLGISYQPALTEPPVTMSRTVRRRGTDYTRLAAVFHLVDGITAHEVSPEDAYRRLADIRRNRHPYDSWVLTGAAGLLAGAASVLVGGNMIIFLAAALAAMLGDRLAWLLAGRGLPEFYQFAAAAMPAAAAGVVVDRYAHWIPGASGVQSSAVITGGLFALLPGRALVAAVQDGLTGFYITASARLLEVVYLVVGIVVGVTLVLYAGVSLGADLDPDQAPRAYDHPWVQVLAAMVLTLAFAVLLQCERGVLLPATLNGGIAWSVFGVLHQDAGGNQVAATAAAAGLVGLFGQLMARYRYVSVLPYVTAAIGPLLPGSATYFGLLALTKHHPDQALSRLTTAAALALALAIGVNLGNEIARMALRTPPPTPRRAAKRTRGF